MRIIYSYRDHEWEFEGDHAPSIGDDVYLDVLVDGEEFTFTVRVVNRFWSYEPTGEISAFMECHFDECSNRGDPMRDEYFKDAVPTGPGLKPPLLGRKP